MERRGYCPMSAVGKTKLISATPHVLPDFRLDPRPKLLHKRKSLLLMNYLVDVPLLPSLRLLERRSQRFDIDWYRPTA